MATGANTWVAFSFWVASLIVYVVKTWLWNKGRIAKEDELYK